MASSRKGESTDLWAEVVASSSKDPQPKGQINTFYGRRRVENPREVHTQRSRSSGGTRVSFAPSKRPSWNRALSIRGRESIIVVPGLYGRPQLSQRGPPKMLRAKKAQPVCFDFEKAKAYFEEVDAYELIEESPSPKHFSTWSMDTKNDFMIHDLPAILERWKRTKFGVTARTHPLYSIMETPIFPSAQSSFGKESLTEKTPERASTRNLPSKFRSYDKNTSSALDVDSNADLTKKCILSSISALRIKDEDITDDYPEIDSGKELEGAIEKDSLALRPKSFSGEYMSAFDQLLVICRQSAEIPLSEIFSVHCETSSISKLGEGTYGEAFRAGETVCKIVPIDGDSLVNGEIQKRSEEVLEEVLLSLTLNSLKGNEGEPQTRNLCTSFIETKDFRVCKGCYDPRLITAWDDWDKKHQSENDHPGDFAEEQRYIVFVLADGGKDLESFVLTNYNEARSLLVQVTFALAVAEAACEFEHRDLHWGNVLLSRNETTCIDFVIDGHKQTAKTYGLTVAIIDFTLSRINTGEAILFLDLSADPELFNGPKRDIQSDTYRRMKEVTEECWEGSFPKTNVLWLIYLVEILLKKKSYERTTKDERELRSFKRRLESYGSARDSLTDSFFTDLLEDH